MLRWRSGTSRHATAKNSALCAIASAMALSGRLPAWAPPNAQHIYELDRHAVHSAGAVIIELALLAQIR